MYIIDKGLKQGRGVGEYERHYKVFEVTQRGVESHLPLVHSRIRTRWYALRRSSLETTWAQ